MRLTLLLLIASLGFSNAQTFKSVTPIDFPRNYNGSMDWGDHDNDGDLDVVLTGDSTSNYDVFTSIYANRGNGVFVKLTTPTIIGVRNSDAVWGDYDKDGDLDIALSGLDASNNPITKIYTNNGTGDFSENTNVSLYRCYNSSLAWGDYNNDGLLDLLVTGDYYMAGVMKIYTNLGNHNFAELKQNFVGITQAAISWIDYDSDGDLDVYASGLVGDMNSAPKTKIYKNEGNGVFTEVLNHGIIGGISGSASWGDYDNDGDPDLIITGGDYLTTKLYTNEDGVFQEKTIAVDSVGEGSSALWGDYDNDGDLDILLNGRKAPVTIVNVITKVFINDGNANFQEYKYNLTNQLPSYSSGSTSIVDYDNDGDLDFCISGLHGGYTSIHLYRNTVAISNQKPDAPTGLKAERVGDKIQLSWNRGTDLTTASKALTYNVRIGTMQNGQDIVHSNSNLSTGFHFLNNRGNAGSDTFFIVNTSQKGTLYWSVQSIDNSFSPSAFSSENVIRSTVTALDESVNENDHLFTSGNKEEFCVDYASPINGFVEFKIMDLNASVLKVESRTKSEQNLKMFLNLSGYKSGIYILEITSGSQAKRRKILLQ